MVGFGYDLWVGRAKMIRMFGMDKTKNGGMEKLVAGSDLTVRE